jgi:hypothetical protein
MKKNRIIILVFFSIIILIPFSYANIINDFSNISLGDTKYKLSDYICSDTKLDYSYIGDNSFICSTGGGNICNVTGDFFTDSNIYAKCRYSNNAKMPPVIMFNKTYNTTFTDFKNISLGCELRQMSIANTNEAFLNLTINDKKVNFGLGTFGGALPDVCKLIWINYNNVYGGVGNDISSCTNIGSLWIPNQYILKKDIDACYYALHNEVLGDTFNLKDVSFYWNRHIRGEVYTSYDFKLEYINFFGNNTNQSINYTSPIISLNNMPLVNITYLNQIQCLEENQNSNLFDISLSTYDIEGDTILYSYQKTDIKNIQKHIKFEKVKCGLFGLFFCDTIIDDSFLNNLYFNDNCNISTNDILSINTHNILYINDKYHLGYNGLCSGVGKSTIIKIDKPVLNVFYATKIIGLTDNKEMFNLTFYDESRSIELLKIKVNVSGTQQYFYNFNGSNYNFIGNRSIYNFLEFSIKHYGNGTQSQFILLNEKGISQNLIFNITTQDINILTRYITLEVGKGLESTTLYQEYISYSGIYPELKYTPFPTTSFNISGLGISEVLFYVTDNYNINSSYDIYRLYFTNKENLYCKNINEQGFIGGENDLYGNRKGNIDNCIIDVGGSPNLFVSLLVLLKLPFLLLCIGGLKSLAGYIGLGIVIYTIFMLGIRNENITFKHIIIVTFLLSTIFLLMNLYFIGVYLVQVLILSLYLVVSFINGER